MKITKNLIERLIKEELQAALHRKKSAFIFEVDETADASQGHVEAAKSMIEKNPFLQRFANDVSNDTLLPIGNEYVLFKYPDLFGHTLKTHGASSGGPGSKFLPAFSSESAMVDVIDNVASKQPSEVAGGRFKWYNVDLGKPIGKDSVKKAGEGEGIDEVDIEKIKSIRALPAIIKGGSRVVGSDKKTFITPEQADEIAANPEKYSNEEYYVYQELKTVVGEMPETNFVNLILGPIGKSPQESIIKMPDGKERQLVTLISMFPGRGADDSGKPLTSKEAFAKAGYVFVKKESSFWHGNVITERWQRLAGIIK